MKPKVAFVCVHNSCRSQMAEAVAKIKASEVFDAYSAGTHIRPEINQDAVKLIDSVYGINMNETQSSKLISDIPEVDVVITMGCNVDCPNLPCKYREDWGLDDPSGKDRLEFEKTLSLIESKIEKLTTQLNQGLLY